MRDPMTERKREEATEDPREKDGRARIKKREC